MGFLSRPITELRGHDAPILAVRFNKDGQYCMTGSQDRTIRLWNPNKGSCIKTFHGHGHEVLDLCIGQDNSKFASCGGDKAVFLWDVGTGGVIRRFQGHIGRINSVDFNLDSSVLASGSYDASVRIWDCRSNSRDPVQILQDASDSVSSVQFSTYELLAASVDGCVRVYDIRMGRLDQDNLGDSIVSARFSWDGNCILTNSVDGVLRLVDKQTGEVLMSYEGHVTGNYKIGCALTADDAHVMAGSKDGKIYVWDLVEGTVVATLEAHAQVVSCLDPCPDATRPNVLISGAADSKAIVWG